MSAKTPTAELAQAAIKAEPELGRLFNAKEIQAEIERTLQNLLARGRRWRGQCMEE